METKKTFYGKWIIIGSLIITVFTLATVNNTVTLYMPAICGDLGFGITEFSVSFSLGAIGGAIGIVLVGFLVQKLPLKTVMIVGTIGCFLSFLGFSAASKLWMFYLALFSIDFFITFVTNVPLTTMINNWYIDKRGTMTGIVFAGGGFGAIILPLIWSVLINNPAIGWHKAAVASAVLILVTALPVCVFLVAKDPASKGQVPFTYPAGSPEALRAAKQRDGMDATADPNEGLTKAQALKSSAFWFLALGMLCMGTIAGGVMTHIPMFLDKLGMTGVVGIVLAIAGVGMLVGTFLMGILFDKIGQVNGMFLTALLFILGLLCLLFTSDKTFMLACIGGGLIGFSACVSQVAPPLFVSSLFGMKDYSALFSFNYAIFMGGCIVGPVVLAGCFDLTSSYSLSWIVSIVLAAAMFLLFFLGFKSGNNLRKKEEAQ